MFKIRSLEKSSAVNEREEIKGDERLRFCMAA
jgi:hypothetical protein